MFVSRFFQIGVSASSICRISAVCIFVVSVSLSKAMAVPPVPFPLVAPAPVPAPTAATVLRLPTDLEKAMRYATGGSAGGLAAEKTDKYDAGTSSLRCAYDDDNTNLSLEGGIVNPLAISKQPPAMYSNSNQVEVLAAMGAAPVVKTGLIATGNCGARP